MQSLPALRTNLRFTVHHQGGSPWFAVHDNHSGRYTRLGHEEYLIASSLDGHRNAEQVAEVVNEQNGPHAGSNGRSKIDADHVTRLCEWLFRQGLLEVPGTGTSQDSPAKKSGASTGLNPLYLRFPLLNGDAVERLAERLKPLVSSATLAVVAVLVVWASMAVALNWQDFTRAASKLFVADARLWWIAAWLLLKAAHEAGHAVTAVYVGSRVRNAGISLICLAPVPFVDMSDLWTIPNRWHRVLCCSAGMLVELGIASIAALVALTTDNLSVQYFCSALATLGTVTTLAFNANPLVRFDGYYIVSDLVNLPNLWTQSNLALKQLVRKLLFPSMPVEHPMHPGLIAYGISCFIYRIVLLGTLAVWALIVWEGIGLFLVAWGAYAIVLLPYLKGRKMKAAQENAPNRQPCDEDLETDASSNSQPRPMTETNLPSQKWWSTTTAGARLAVGIGILATIFCLLPSPVQPSAPAIVAFRDPSHLRSATEGTLVEVYVDLNAYVEEGQSIARFVNPALELDFERKRLELEASQEKIATLRARGEMAKCQAEEAQLKSLSTQYNQLAARVAELHVVAPRAGTLVQSELHQQVGRFFRVGEPLCLLADARDVEVRASVSQENVEELEQAIGQPIAVRMRNGERVIGVLERVDPRGHTELSEPAFAANYGGGLTVELETDDAGRESLQLSEPRFDVHIRIGTLASHLLVPGQLASMQLPGKSTSVGGGVSNWLKQRWRNLLQQANSSSSES